MRKKLFKTQIGLAAVMVFVLLASVSPLDAYPCLDQPQRLQWSSVLNLDFDLAAVLTPGVLGLPGEPVAWVITVTNNGQAPAHEVVITDAVPASLRIDRAETTQGTVAISDPVVVFAIPVLNPGATVEMVIETTVLYSPPDGKLVNQALLAATGPDGAVAQRVSAEVVVPTGLPATGYSPEDASLPGEGEPPVFVVGLVALGVVGMAAAFVWRRGRRYF